MKGECHSAQKRHHGVSFRSLRGLRCPGKNEPNRAMFRRHDTTFQACISYLTWPLQAFYIFPPRSLREDEVQRTAGLIDLFDGGQALFVRSRDPELMNDAHELPHALMKNRHCALGIGVPGVA